MVKEDPSAGGRYFEIRYEDIVLRPRPTLQHLFEFIGAPWEPGVLEFHAGKHDLADETSAGQVSKPLYSGSIERWRRDLDEEQLAALLKVAGPVLSELGYIDGRGDSTGES